MTDMAFAERDRKVPGYIDAIYIMDWTATNRYKKIEEAIPKMAPKRKPTPEELLAARGPRRTESEQATRWQ